MLSCNLIRNTLMTLGFSVAKCRRVGADPDSFMVDVAFTGAIHPMAMNVYSLNENTTAQEAADLALREIEEYVEGTLKSTVETVGENLAGQQRFRLMLTEDADPEWAKEWEALQMGQDVHYKRSVTLRVPKEEWGRVSILLGRAGFDVAAQEGLDEYRAHVDVILSDKYGVTLDEIADGYVNEIIERSLKFHLPPWSAVGAVAEVLDLDRISTKFKSRSPFTHQKTVSPELMQSLEVEKERKSPMSPFKFSGKERPR